MARLVGFRIFGSGRESHRRLVFMASCQLMQAVFLRFHYFGMFSPFI
jgi:hypothetical protein